MTHPSLGILILLGTGLLGGALGASIFQRLRIPQVVGYIVIGLLLGQSGFGLIQPADEETLRPFNLFALGIIGFLVGGELKIDTFRKYGKQFAAILLGEGLAAFVLVGLGTFALLYMVIQNATLAAAAGVVFGAIASATDPASTIDVLWEYRARGVLTTSVTAIVALDDALAMTLYGLGTGVAQLLASGSADFSHEVMRIGIELIGALVAGFVFALVVQFLLRWLTQPEKVLAISIGAILLLIGLAVHIGMDVILAAMMLGFSLVNLAPRRSESIFKLLRGFSSPIYVLFFVLVGARLAVKGLPMWLWGIVGLYVLGRSVGKMAGAWAGARFSRAPEVVCRYLGLSLFAQGGVAVGLSILASQHLADIQVSGGLSLGDAIIFAVTATTLIVQVSGPPLVKYAVQLAGEIGRNITDDDIIDESRVENMMSKDITPLCEDTTLAVAVDTFARSPYSVLPVIGRDRRLLGMVSLQGMRNVLADQSSWQWLLVSDILEPVRDRTTPATPLREALDHMRQVNIDQMAVVGGREGEEVVGILDSSQVRRRIADEVLRRHGDD